MATKKQVNERNKLLWKVIRHIKAEPKRLDMNIWEMKDADVPCGTSACMFGWANLLGRKKPVNLGITEDFFLSVCGLLSLDSEEGDRLAYSDSWPSKYMYQYEMAATPRGRVQATTRRIEHFIKTGE